MILVAATALAATAIAAPARHKNQYLPISAVTLVLDGEPVSRRPDDRPRQALFDLAVEQLRPHGFVVLASTDREQLLGGAALERAEIGVLHIDMREPSFSFRAGYRAKAGTITITDAATGKRLFKKDVDVRSDLPFDGVRRQFALDPLAAVLTNLWTAPNLVGRTNPFVVLLLQVNDLGRDHGSFLAAARRLAALPHLSDTAPFIDIAADPRSAADPVLRAELVHRAVAALGAGAIPPVTRALTRTALGENEDAALTALLVESLDQLGASPGDALLPVLRQRPLPTLLLARNRFTFRTGAAELDRRIADLARVAIGQAPSFAAAEELCRTLPLGALPPSSRMALRDALYRRIPPGDADAALERMRRVFPPEQYPAEAEDRVDETFLASVGQLQAASVQARLGHYRDYLLAAPRARAAERLAHALAIGPALEAELATRVSAASPGAGDAALVAVYGPNPWPEARAALARVLVGSLGDAPSEATLLALRSSHPDVPAVEDLVRARGLVRDRDHHVFPVALGDGMSAVLRALGKPGRREEGLLRRDLSPAAAVKTGGRIADSDGKGFAALDYPDVARILFREGSAFRIQIDDSRGKFHHGVRTGDSREEAVQALGPPSEERALMFGREVVAWRGIHQGAADLYLVFDKERVSFLWEEQAGAARTVLASLR